MDVFLQIENIYKSLTSLSPEEKIMRLSMLQLRFFTPKEIANLLGFPPEFGMWDTCGPQLSCINGLQTH